MQLKYQYKYYDKQHRNEDDVINQSEVMCSKAGSIIILASKPGKWHCPLWGIHCL